MQPQKSILVVDDDVISAKVIADYLKSENYPVDVFNESQAAWQHLRQFPEKYAAIFIDRIMPKLDAISFLRRMRSHAVLQHIPVIVMTGEADSFEEAEVRNAGIFAFVFKPVNKEHLLEITQRALEKF